jgi:hypothetical protein
MTKLNVLNEVISEINYDDGSLRDVVVSDLEKDDWILFLKSISSKCSR